MARWGLRWIFCWLSVLITACGQLASPTPADKTQNRTPLQGFTPPPMASPTEPFRPAYTLTPLGNPTRLGTPHNSNLDLQQPVCYETPTQSLVCLGWIQNPGNISLTDVFIDVHLLSTQGQSFASANVMPALEILFPQSGSPYRAVFQAIPTESWTVYANLTQAREIPASLVLRYLSLEVENFEAEWSMLSYQVSGKVTYEGEHPIEQVWVVVTVWDKVDIVSGFRMLQLDWQDEILDFEMEVAPLNQMPGEFVTVLAQGIN